MRFRTLRDNQQGFLLPAVLTFMIAMAILSGAVLEVVLNNFNVVGNNQDSQQAFNIAEAGVNYYLWHLSHSSTDFKDGKTTPATPDPTLGYGPYVHDYIDSNSVKQGTFTLWIKPQTGSTIATVRAIGQAKGSGRIRTIQAQIGAPSFASYAVASDSALWFGSTESASGPVHSNAGVRMDGASDSEISSANVTYTPSRANGGCSTSNCSHPGVWCDTSVTTPVACLGRDTSNWFPNSSSNPPAAAVDFNQVSSSLCTMKKVALNNFAATACSTTPSTRTSSYIPQLSSTFDATKGYVIELYNNVSNTPVYDLYKVSGENDTKTTATSALGIAAGTLVASGVSVPSSGVIFTEDNVWVMNKPGLKFDGRVTVASGRLATNNSTNIILAGPLVYASKNGSDAIGLVAENSVYVAPYAPSGSSGFGSGTFQFEVDAAVLAENGEVQFGEDGDDAQYPYDYRQSQATCTPGWVNSSQTMLFYGSIATRQRWTWTWDLVLPHAAMPSRPRQEKPWDTTFRVSIITRPSMTTIYSTLHHPVTRLPVATTYCRGAKYLRNLRSINAKNICQLIF